jgi:hypothetical protein
MAKQALTTGRFQFGTATFTVNASTDVVTSNAHGLVDGMIIQVSSTTTLPDPLAADTDYYIISATTNTFKVSTTRGGSAVDLTDTGTGTHSWVPHYAVTSFQFDENYGEVNMTDTGTTGSGEEFAGGRYEASFTVSIIKDVAVADLTMNTSTTALIDFQGATYSGSVYLLSHGVTAQIDGRVEETYNGRFSGTVTKSP